MKKKIDKFNKDMPLIAALGGNGMQGRHWDQIQEHVGKDVRPRNDTTLKEMLEYNLGSHIEKIEEISVKDRVTEHLLVFICSLVIWLLGEHVRWTFGKASKEHALEKSLEKMQEDWEEIVFNLLPYRDTDINILGGMDELQILLDDQLIKCQG